MRDSVNAENPDEPVAPGDIVEIAPAMGDAGQCWTWRRHRYAKIDRRGHVICETCRTDHGPFRGHA